MIWILPFMGTNESWGEGGAWGWYGWGVDHTCGIRTFTLVMLYFPVKMKIQMVKGDERESQVEVIEGGFLHINV